MRPRSPVKRPSHPRFALASRKAKSSALSKPGDSGLPSSLPSLGLTLSRSIFGLPTDSSEVRPKILERTQGIIRHNLGILADWVASCNDLFSYTPPDAGAIAMVRYRQDIGSAELAERLRVEQSVLIVPGHHFGIDSTMRLGFGLPENELVEGLDRQGAAFEGPLRVNGPGLRTRSAPGAPA